MTSLREPCAVSVLKQTIKHSNFSKNNLNLSELAINDDFQKLLMQLTDNDNLLDIENSISKNVDLEKTIDAAFATNSVGISDKLPLIIENLLKAITKDQTSKNSLDADILKQLQDIQDINESSNHTPFLSLDNHSLSTKNYISKLINANLLDSLKISDSPNTSDTLGVELADKLLKFINLNNTNTHNSDEKIHTKDNFESQAQNAPNDNKSFSTINNSKLLIYILACLQSLDIKSNQVLTSTQNPQYTDTDAKNNYHQTQTPEKLLPLEMSTNTQNNVIQTQTNKTAKSTLSNSKDLNLENLQQKINANSFSSSNNNPPKPNGIPFQTTKEVFSNDFHKQQEASKLNTELNIRTQNDKTQYSNKLFQFAQSETVEKPQNIKAQSQNLIFSAQNNTPEIDFDSGVEAKNLLTLNKQNFNFSDFLNISNEANYIEKNKNKISDNPIDFIIKSPQENMIGSKIDLAQIPLTKENNPQSHIHTIIEKILDIKSLNPPVLKTITVQLNPPSLGSLDIKVSIDSNKNLTAAINVQNQDLFNTLNNNLDYLKNTLQIHGFNVSQINISSSQSFQDFNQHSNHQQQAFNQFDNSQYTNNKQGQSFSHAFNQSSNQQKQQEQHYYFQNHTQKIKHVYKPSEYLIDVII